MTLGESLVAWALLLGHELYLSYIKRVIKTISQTTGTYTTILKNKQKKTLDTIIAENQAAAI